MILEKKIIPPNANLHTSNPVAWGKYHLKVRTDFVPLGAHSKTWRLLVLRRSYRHSLTFSRAIRHWKSSLNLYMLDVRGECPLGPISFIPKAPLSLFPPCAHPKDTTSCPIRFHWLGPQHIRVGQSLFVTSEVFRNTIPELDQVLEAATGYSLIKTIGLFDSSFLT